MNSINTEMQYRVHQKAIYRAACHPSATVLYDLYGGDKFQPIPQQATPALLESPLHFSTDVNAAHIQAVCSLNCFGYNQELEKPDLKRSVTPEQKIDSCAALYLLPSYLNHSCAPNAAREFLGEVMIIRACMTIKKGEEITIAYHGRDGEFASRTKGLQKWIQNCDCNLCQQDRISGAQTRKQRRLILDEIYEPSTSISRLRTLIKQLAGLYPASYGLYRSQLSEAHHALTTRLQQTAIRSPANMSLLYLEAIQEEIASLEALQVRVVDKRTSQGPKSKATVLPISTDIVPYDCIRAGMRCLTIGACFNALAIEWRAERWIAAAIWSMFPCIYLK